MHSWRMRFSDQTAICDWTRKRKKRSRNLNPGLTAWVTIRFGWTGRTGTKVTTPVKYMQMFKTPRENEKILIWSWNTDFMLSSIHLHREMTVFIHAIVIIAYSSILNY